MRKAIKKTVKPIKTREDLLESQVQILGKLLDLCDNAYVNIQQVNRLAAISGRGTSLNISENTRLVGGCSDFNIDPETTKSANKGEVSSLIRLATLAQNMIKDIRQNDLFAKEAEEEALDKISEEDVAFMKEYLARKEGSFIFSDVERSAKDYIIKDGSLLPPICSVEPKNIPPSLSPSDLAQLCMSG